MKILYLEDNHQDAALVKRYVQTTEHELAIVSTVDDAEAQCDESVDLFLLDILIDNERAGLEFVKKLRRAGFMKPLVAVTALSSDADIENCRNAGVNAVLVKPYNIMHLAEIISEMQGYQSR
jgi:two-component system, sensor histidine kinase